MAHGRVVEAKAGRIGGRGRQMENFLGGPFEGGRDCVWDEQTDW